MRWRGGEGGGGHALGSGAQNFWEGGDGEKGRGQAVKGGSHALGGGGGRERERGGGGWRGRSERVLM
jgi:hypothetical protein